MEALPRLSPILLSTVHYLAMAGTYPRHSKLRHLVSMPELGVSRLSSIKSGLGPIS
ncbi:hypothetical protein PA598K_05937 [Paenibacillus sp. 598K]|nr:hypothetical protein PA598K_05937 [Paenibacillus sp. 598K]